MKKLRLTFYLLAVIGASSPQASAQRFHRITEKGVLAPQASTVTPEIPGSVTIEVVGEERIIKSNGIPNHATGQFPGRGNPNRITAQTHEYRVPAQPEIAERISPMQGEFGVAINGVPFDPGAAEFYDGEPGWQYEPLSGAIALGIDVSHAHVQPNGKYHYHGLPTGLLDSVKVEAGMHSPLIGWAADGFPIYAVYGYSNPQDPESAVRKLTSSYQLKKGERPGGDAPSGPYDGTFVRDYEYVADSGDLDECNGRHTVTPEFPEGTYAYFMTEEWPVVPRNFRGTPSRDFMHGPGVRGPGVRGGRGLGVRGPGARDARGPEGRGPEGRGPEGRGPEGRGPEGRGPGARDFRGPGDRGPGDRGPEGRGDRGPEDRGPEGRGERGDRPGGRGGPDAGGRKGPDGEPPMGPGRRGREQGGPGRLGPGTPPKPGQLLPAFIRDSLDLDEAQIQQLDALQAMVDERLAEILNEEQQRKLQDVAPPKRPPSERPNHQVPPHHGPPPAGRPDAGPRAGRPDRRPPGEGRPERGRPERGGPERRGPERGGPERGGPERGGPERGGPERGGPERGGPERGGPERGGPERGGPERGGTERRGPDGGRHERGSLDRDRPDRGGPGRGGPERRGTDRGRPDRRGPDRSGPEHADGGRPEPRAPRGPGSPPRGGPDHERPRGDRLPSDPPEAGRGGRDADGRPADFGRPV